jgi:hypothetical protein
MPLLPLDLQTLFTQTSQVGREQAAQKEASPQAQSLQGAQMAQKTEQKDNAVNATPEEQEEGSEKVKDRTGRGGKRKRDALDSRKKRTAALPPATRTIVQDPALGRNIDITS